MHPTAPSGYPKLMTCQETCTLGGLQIDDVSSDVPNGCQQRNDVSSDVHMGIPKVMTCQVTCAHGDLACDVRRGRQDDEHISRGART
jgi:hypothetical protein